MTARVPSRARPLRPLPGWVALVVSLGIHAQVLLGSLLLGGGVPWSSGERGVIGGGGDTIEISVQGGDHEEPAAPDPEPPALDTENTPTAEAPQETARRVLASRDRSPDFRVREGEAPEAEPTPAPTEERASTPAPPMRTGSDRERSGRAPGDEAASVILGSLGLGGGRNASRALLERALECDDPVAGVWSAQRYSPERRNWGRMTLRIRREGDELTGTITSRVWNGMPSDPAPSPCGPGQYDMTVRMPARGRVQGDGFTFGSRSYDVTGVDCADPGFMYYPDSFRGTVDSLHDELDALNNDGHVEFDAPYRFRRTSCGRE